MYSNDYLIAHRRHNNGDLYTDENVLGFNVFVHSMEPILAARQLEDFCVWNFGPVKMCCVYPARFNKPAYGFIVFNNVKSAAKMLDNRQYRYLESVISVRPAAAWWQRNPLSMKCTDRGCDFHGKIYASVGSQRVTIFDLIYGCQVRVIQQLALKDKIHFARTSARFADILRSNVSYETLNLGVLNGLTLWQCHDFFYFFGDKIECIISEEDHSDLFLFVLPLIGIHCQNLTSLTIHKTNLTNDLCKIITEDSEIRKLHLKECNLDDEAIEILQDLKHLKILELPINSQATGDTLNTLSNIQELDLAGCSNVGTEELIAALKNLKQLRVLNIIGCSKLLPKVYETLFEYNQCLQALRTNLINDGLPYVLGLPFLKELMIYGDKGRLTYEFFQLLAEKKSRNLKTLLIRQSNVLNPLTALLLAKLTGLKSLYLYKNDGLHNLNLHEFRKCRSLEKLALRDCNMFSPDCLLDVIKELRYLKWLDLRGCLQFNFKFFCDVFKLLVYQFFKRERRQKLEIVVKSAYYNKLNLKVSVNVNYMHYS